MQKVLIFLLTVSRGCLVWSASFDARTKQVVSGLLLLVPVIISVVGLDISNGVRSKHVVVDRVILVCHSRQRLVDIARYSDSLPVEYHLLSYRLSLHRLLIILDEVGHQNIATISSLR